MKKILISLVVILFLVIACTYILIPSTIRVSKSATIHANKNALYRKLVNPETWDEWWPEKQTSTVTSKGHTLQGMRFSPGEPKIISLPVFISSSGLSGSSEITFIPLGIDSTILHFEVSIPASGNPFKRISMYFKSKQLKKRFSVILNSINNTYSGIKNLYNYDIQKKRVVDSSLIFTSVETKGVPDINSIYSLIDKLSDYISRNAAKETGSPMLNIFKKDSTTWLVKVAIPVDKKLPSSGNISYRWMLGGGNILVTEVKGGQTEIDKAYKQILNYISDYRRTAPAIPFESLVTDRRKEPDSSKWVTRIYYPVM
jgi:effector-binding domain-containing protein